MVFCNMFEQYKLIKLNKCHNPYFNRWFSAIGVKMEKNEFLQSQSLF